MTAKPMMAWSCLIIGLLFSISGECAAATQIQSGTKIGCRLEQTISSATADEGQQVQLTVTEDVKIGNTVVIAQGAPVIGTIVEATAKRRMGRTGKLDFSIDKVRVADGEFIPLRYSMNKKEGGSHAVSTGVMTAGAAVLFWPAAPFFLLRHGKDVTINKGIVFEVFIDQDHVMRNSPNTSISESHTATEMSTTVSITSDIAGAEIEVDGKFTGNTPSTMPLSAGKHTINVKSGRLNWERSIELIPGSTITLSATLKNQ